MAVHRDVGTNQTACGLRIERFTKFRDRIQLQEVTTNLLKVDCTRRGCEFSAQHFLEGKAK